MPPDQPRPSVTVAVPFHGTRDEATGMLRALQNLRLLPGDEVVVADNTGAATVTPQDGVIVIPAGAERSSYYARNCAAEAASNRWIAFIDADTLPDPDLLDAFFAQPVDDDIGAVIGEVRARRDQDALIARYSRSRDHIVQEHHWRHPYRPYGVTANLLVRREAWASVGGFLEGVRSSGDVDFSWRLQEAGWRLDYRPAAVVEHSHRERLRALLRVGARYGAGRAWLHRRYPEGMGPSPVLRPTVRAIVGTCVWLVTGRFERAAFKAIDGLYVVSQAGAGLLSNIPPGADVLVAGADTALILDRFPDLADEERTRAVLRLADRRLLVEATARPLRPDRPAARDLAVHYREDDGALRRLRALAWLSRRSPAAVARAMSVDGVRASLREACVAQRVARAGAGSVRVAADGGSGTRAALVGRLAGVTVSGPPA